MKTIPQIRDRLSEIGAHLKRNYSDELGDEILGMVEDMKRRPPARRAGIRIVMSDAMKQDIIDCAAAFPDASYQEIADACKTNSGRVSEIIAGKRSEANG